MRTLLLLALLLTPAIALARGPMPVFVPARDADLQDQPNGKRQVAHLRAGQSYPLLKTGGPGGAWCKLQADGEEGWLPCSERQLSPAPATSPREAPRPQPVLGGASGCASTCAHAPLFGEPVQLTPLDREVLAMCPAHPDASVSEGDVRRFFAAHLSDARIQTALSQSGRSGAREENLDWLTHLFVGAGPKNAFTHIFCGDDWGKDKLGGLHFLPRYAQLEREGKLCYGGPVKGSAIAGAQYLIRYQGVAPWSCGTKHVGGFPVDHDAIALVATAIRAFTQCCGRTGRSGQGGVFHASDLGGPAWRIWCGERNGSFGIDSMYPTDERPTCGER